MGVRLVQLTHQRAPTAVQEAMSGESGPIGRLSRIGNEQQSPARRARKRCFRTARALGIARRNISAASLTLGTRKFGDRYAVGRLASLPVVGLDILRRHPLNERRPIRCQGIAPGCRRGSFGDPLHVA